MNIEELKLMVSNWDTKKTINCTQLRLAIGECYNTIDVTCCSCQGALQRGVDKIRYYISIKENK